MEIRGKRLLILGANVETIPIVRRAQEMGIEVIVTDHVLNSPAKVVANEYYDINGKDVNAIINIIKKRNIDGILVGVADPLISSYVEICNKMKLPYLIARESINFFSNKRIFKSQCKKNGLPVIQEFFSCMDIHQIDIKSLQYPLIVKPAVGRGGKGICLCKNEDEFEDAFSVAKINSDNYEVVGEEYINSVDVVATFICEGGRTHLLTMSDRIMLKNDGEVPTVTFSNIYPSKHIKKFKDKYLKIYCALFKMLHITNGIVNIQMFVKDDDFIPYDPDCIINGECASNLFNSIFQVDIIGKCICYALTGEFNFSQIDMNNKTCMGASIWIILKPGIIGRIEGKHEVEEKGCVVDSIWRLEEGNEVTERMYHTEKSALARIWIKAESRKELDYEICEIRRIVKVTDNLGRNMILSR